MRMYDNPAGDMCFPSSLANLLLLQEEPDLAQNVFNEYERHPLITAMRKVGLRGSYIGYMPRLVSDFTDGKYSCTVRVMDAPLNYWPVKRGGVLPPSFDLEYAVADAAVARGQFFFNQSAPVCATTGSPQFEIPTMVFMTCAINNRVVLKNLDGEYTYDYSYTGVGGHAAVALPEGYFIDDGLTVFYHPQVYIKGYLQLKRSKNGRK